MTRGLGGHSPSNVSHHLKGIDFPANIDELFDQAKRNGARGDILEIIDNMPDIEYYNMADVMKAYGKVSRSDYAA